MNGSDTSRAPDRPHGNAWRTLRSLKFGIAILLILAAACGLGMVVPQGAPESVYLTAYGQVGSRLLHRLGLADVFHSLWFYVLALALGVNLTACTVHRFQLTWRRNYGSPRAPDPGTLRRADAVSWAVAAPLDQVEQAVTAALQQRRFAVRRAQANPAGVYLHAMRGRIGNWGSGLLHLSVLIIFIGVVYGQFPGVRIGGRTIGNRGFEQQVQLSQGGEPYTPPGADYAVRLLHFRAPVDERGQAEQFYSDLQIIEHDKVVAQPTISVNHPYARGGFSLYQTAWALDGFAVRVTPPQGEPQDLFVPAAEGGFDMMQSILPLRNPKWVFFVHEFAPDGAIVNGEGVPRGPYPGNPIAQVFVSESPQLNAEKMHRVGWIGPGLDQVYKGVRFSMLGAVSRSVLTVRRDPGIPVVWAGFWLLMGGLVLALYLPARTLRVLIAPDGQRARLTAVPLERVGLERDLAALQDIGASLRKPASKGASS